jgi:PadR family transcriptional regulator AphA
MDYEISQIGDIRFLECKQSGGIVKGESEAIDLIGLCSENLVNTVLLYIENLPSGFFDLKSGIAGSILLKFSNYFVRVAAVIPIDISNQGRFHEMVLETNRGKEFRVFTTRSDAVEWIGTIG